MAHIIVSIEHAGHTYTADQDEQGVTIIDRDGIWAGTGNWDADAERIVDCPANIPEAAYAALAEAIVDAS